MWPCFGAYDDRLSDYDRNNPLRRWGWELRHPNGMVYLLGLNSVTEPWHRRQFIHSSETFGLPVFQTPRTSTAPLSARIADEGNWFAVRVHAIDVIE